MDFWNDPPDDDLPECCEEYMEIDSGTGAATCLTCGSRIEPDAGIEPVLEDLPDPDCKP